MFINHLDLVNLFASIFIRKFWIISNCTWKFLIVFNCTIIFQNVAVIRHPKDIPNKVNDVKYSESYHYWNTCSKWDAHTTLYIWFKRFRFIFLLHILFIYLIYHCSFIVNFSINTIVRLSFTILFRSIFIIFIWLVLINLGIRLLY